MPERAHAHAHAVRHDCKGEERCCRSTHSKGRPSSSIVIPVCRQAGRPARASAKECQYPSIVKHDVHTWVSHPQMPERAHAFALSVRLDSKGKERCCRSGCSKGCSPSLTVIPARVDMRAGVPVSVNSETRAHQSGNLPKFAP
jgi:hypothetical protein